MNPSQRPSVLLVTTDQQRWDSLGYNGNRICRTPTVDGLAATGVRYDRAHTQNVLCTPSRCTILTGQYPGTHGAWCNGVALPPDAPSVADVLASAGYATSLIGKVHFEPGNSPYLHGLLRSEPSWNGPYRGFQHLEAGAHVPVAHYGRWLREQLGDDAFRDYVDAIRATLMGHGGDTGAAQVRYDSLGPEHYLTSWAVDRALAWLDGLPDDQPFFCWLSFDDPHPPLRVPESYGRRHDWRSIPLPAGRPTSADAVAADLATKPWQYGAYWRGEYVRHEGNIGFPPGQMTDDQVRERLAVTYGMIELIDEQLGRLLDALGERGRSDTTHVLFTTDHGDLGGDHGLSHKGPFHLDGLVRVPLIWRRPDAPSAVVTDPVGLVDLAPTICDIARVPAPEWTQGESLPTGDGTRSRVVTVYDSSYLPELKLRSMYRDGWFVTRYPNAPEVGELYNLTDDPCQFRNLWSEGRWRSLRDELVAELSDHVVEDHRPERLPCLGHA